MNKSAVYALFGIFAFVLLSNVADSTTWSMEAGEIPYQAGHSDRIIIGTVKSMSSSFDFTDVIISVDEWLKNPLPESEIIVRTEWGTNAFTAGAAKFSVGEKAILMLNDDDTGKGRFRMAFMELGKHDVSERDEVIKGILFGTTKSMFRSGGGIQILDPDAAKPAITKENASSIASGIIRIPVDRARITLINDTRYISRIYWEFTYMEDDKKQAILEIGAATGEVLAYFSFNKIKDKVSIPENQSLEKAKESLKNFSLNIDNLELSKPSVELNNVLGGKLYQIEWIQQSNGIPVFDGFIRVGVDADGGSLISFVKHIHDVSGIEMIPEITKNDAIATAKDFAGKTYDNPPPDVQNAVLEIRPLFQYETPKGALTWKITMGDNRSGYNVVDVWVDAVSGNAVAVERIKGAEIERNIFPLIAGGALIPVVLLVLYMKYRKHR
ncbi:MAG: hypothetical protein FIB08_05780 [Candidatus Methanoperedens sp.]|nr:hypothetical protein [Candidatus Methanoperedens sp.]